MKTFSVRQIASDQGRVFLQILDCQGVQTGIIQGGWDQDGNFEGVFTSTEWEKAHGSCHYRINLEKVDFAITL